MLIKFGQMRIPAGAQVSGKTDWLIDLSKKIVWVNRQGLTAARYREEILIPRVRLLWDAKGLDFVLMDDNACPHKAQLVDAFLETEDIACGLPARFSALNPMENLWNALESREAILLQDLRAALQEEWALDWYIKMRMVTLLTVLTLRCRACIAVRGDHTRYWTDVTVFWIFPNSNLKGHKGLILKGWSGVSVTLMFFEILSAAK